MEINTKETLFKEESMDLANIFMMMGKFMKEHGKMILKKERAFLFLKMGLNM